MKPPVIAVIAVIVVIVVVGVFWWMPKARQAALEGAVAEIEAIEDLAERQGAAIAFAVNNPMADPALLERAFSSVAGQLEADGDIGKLIVFHERFLDMGLRPEPHYTVLAQLDRILIETGDPTHAERAEELARELLVADDAPIMPYLWLSYYHGQSEFTDPRLRLDVALAGEGATDRDGSEDWAMALDMAYGGYLGSIAEDKGLVEAIAAARDLVAEAPHPLAEAAIHTNVYSLAVEMEDEVAVDAARALSETEQHGDWAYRNRVAYSLAEHGLEPELSVMLAEQALGLVTDDYSRGYVLDTAGWAHYKAGNHDAAIGHLEDAVGMLDETPTSDDEVVRHLLVVYDAAGRDDDAIEFLTLLAARSVIADDPVRDRLAALLVERDGTAKHADQMVAERRYDGVENAPEFDLPERGGGTVALADLRGDIAVICFFSYG